MELVEKFFMQHPGNLLRLIKFLHKFLQEAKSLTRLSKIKKIVLYNYSGVFPLKRLIFTILLLIGF